MRPSLLWSLLLAASAASAQDALPSHLAADADAGHATVGVFSCYDAAEVLSHGLQVCDEQGAPLGTHLYPSLPGDPVLVAFDASSAASSYQLQRGVMPAAWEPQAGVFVECRHRVDGPADSYDQATALWAHCLPLHGCCLQPNVFLGINPCGETLDFGANFQGSFLVTTPGSYRFATVSDDASFIAIDGSPLVQWGGWHGYDGGRHGEHAGSITLAPGVHHLQYLYFQNGDNPVEMVAWTPPGADRPEVMPAAAFLPVSRWHEVASATSPGFSWTISGSSRTQGQEVEVVAFTTALSAGESAHWRFDDGISAEGAAISHVYSHGGVRLVHCERGAAGATPVITERMVAVHPAWQQLDEWSDEWSAHARQELIGRDPRLMPAADVLGEVRYAAAIEDYPWLKSVALICAGEPAHWGVAGAELLCELGFQLQRSEVRCYQQAADCWNAALTVMSGHSALRDHMALHYAGLLIHGLDRGPAGAAVLAKTDPTLLQGGETRLFTLYQGDAALAAGDVEGARARYREAGDVVNPRDLAYGVRRRLRLEAAKRWCDSRDYEPALQAMRDIEWETPMERLGCETGLIKVRAYLGQKEVPFALACCHHLLVAVGPDEHRSEVLQALVGTCLAGGDRSQALEVAKVLIKDHPYSEAAAEVKELLPEMNR